jgi:hypothetical protein
MNFGRLSLQNILQLRIHRVNAVRARGPSKCKTQQYDKLPGWPLLQLSIGVGQSRNCQERTERPISEPTRVKYGRLTE